MIYSFRADGGIITHFFRTNGGSMKILANYYRCVGISLCFAFCFGAAVVMLPSTSVSASDRSEALVIDHRFTDLSTIESDLIETAKRELVIAYGHTSHGSQLVTGMQGLVDNSGSLYAFNGTGSNDALQLRDMVFRGASDLGNPDRTSWADATRTYLNDHTEVNVVIWSWCGQVSSAKETDIETYLTLMSGLERDYPGVMFVYMTGHLDGSGLDGNLHRRNEQIRAFCIANNRILYDFADIESYNPDGVYFGNKIPNDNCDYDSDGNGNRDANWAIEWQNANPGKWYQCSAAHSQPLNGNIKAAAAWHLWAGLASSLQPTFYEQDIDQSEFNLLGNTPNPFNASTTIRFSLTHRASVRLSIYNTAGQLVRILADGNHAAGRHEVVWNGTDESGRTVMSGVYVYRLSVPGTSFVVTKKMMHLK